MGKLGASSYLPFCCHVPLQRIRPARKVYAVHAAGAPEEPRQQPDLHLVVARQSYGQGVRSDPRTVAR
ncbi:hypothetical protein ZHAS_00008557 [Anopheles sinensis]|uniref:Uncharacterized protein n=1 Tax=Anopheles sinensis TaxID=74873 RepID=A0A084VT06_ANOSI|nr:hypothetical protein ZHAS_00008557 [Anopheles sinensis]